MKRLLIISLLCFSFSSLCSQTIVVVEQGQKISLRGLSMPSTSVVWASGSNGKVAKSVDGGNTFRWMTVEGYGKRDFRDIEAFDSSTAIIMAVDTPAIILKTTDGGKTWRKVFEDARPGMFLDAMDFSGNNGVVIGDPINGKTFMAVSNDKGDSWVPKETLDIMKDGEAFFASSGSNIKLLGLKRGRKTLFVSGGIQSRFFYNGKAINLPLQSGRNSTGANGLALNPNQQQGIIIGGDFANDKRSDSAILLFSLYPTIKFTDPVTPPLGYKSAAVYLSPSRVLSCGTSGVDLSIDGGLNWKNTSNLGFHVAVKSPDGKFAILAGGNGRIAKLHY
jgi:DNA-binding beta-propeller fold protein YncE